MLGCIQQMHICVVSVDSDTNAHMVMDAHTKGPIHIQIHPHVSIRL